MNRTLDSGYVIALDMGGTNLRIALISCNGDIVKLTRVSTEARMGVEAILKRLTQAIFRVVEKSGLEMKQIRGIAMAVAGGIDIKRGMVTESPNLPGWKNVPLMSLIEAHTGKRALLINDASAAAWGEYNYGKGKGTRDMVYLTISTGIGGGIIINGTLYQGANGIAGEIGHMIIKEGGPRCSCGNKGCFEAMVSGTALVREAEKRIKKGEAKELYNAVLKQGGKLTAKTIAYAAKSGDQVAGEIIDEAGYYLGIGLTNVVNIFNPDMIIMGGGLSKIGSPLFRPAKKIVNQKAFNLAAQSVKIVKSNLGDRAGLLGASALLFQQSHEGN